jgi:hypothetical protein
MEKTTSGELRMKHFLGYLILTVLVLALYAADVMLVGWLAATIIFAGAFIFMALAILAIKLISS